MNTPFKLDATNLVDALIAAIAFSKEPNGENYNACCLSIYEDNTFWINQRCYSNSSFSGYKESRDYYCLTVPATAYPAQNWPLALAEFCARYAIKVTTSERTDLYGKVRPAAWDRHNKQPSISLAGINEHLQHAFTGIAY